MDTDVNGWIPKGEEIPTEVPNWNKQYLAGAKLEMTQFQKASGIPKSSS